MQFVIPFIIAAFLGLIPANIAKSKGRSFGAWWFYGWMLFIVALIHSLVLKSPEEEAFREQQKQYMEATLSGNSAGVKSGIKNVKRVEINSNATVESLLKRAYIFLEDEDWDSADSYCEAVLDMEPENEKAYLGKMMAELEVTSKEKLADLPETFEENDNYKKVIRFGSDELLDEIRNYIYQIKIRNENARIDGIYKNAVELLDEAKTETDYENIAEYFKSIIAYKDSEKLYNDCIDKANEARIESERKAEEKRIAAEIQKKKRAKTLKIVLPILTVIIAGIIIFTTVIQPMLEYNSAVALMEEGMYEEAISAFEEMNGYKDSAEQISECKYLAAVELMNNKKYEAAIAAFEKIKLYKDSSDLIIDCKNEINEAKYIKAVALYEKGEYEAARVAFEEIKAYKDSNSLIAECIEKINEEKYLEAVKLFEEGKLEDAIAAFEEIKDYKDSAEKIETIKKEQKYLKAVSLMEDKKYKEAKKIFEEIKDYKDSQKKIKTCNNKINANNSKKNSNSNINVEVNTGSFGENDTSNDGNFGGNESSNNGSTNIYKGFRYSLFYSSGDGYCGYNIYCNNCGGYVDFVYIDHAVAGYGNCFICWCICGNEGELYI